MRQPERPRPELISWRAGEVRFWVVVAVLVPALVMWTRESEQAGIVSFAAVFAVAIVARFRKFFSPRRLPVRWQRRIAALFALAMIGYGTWLFWPPPDRLPNVAGARSVDVKFYFEPGRLGATSKDPEAIAELASTFAKAERTQAHKCGPRGLLIFQRWVGQHSIGLATKIEFLAGHDPGWYELVYYGKFYRVPRDEFVATMKRIGVDVPLTSP